ncbi:MAG: cyanophycinase, partial [Bdellovibrionota bacterium]
GKLIIIGGAEDKKGSMIILKEFVSLAGGSNARILIMTAATEHAAEVGGDYTRIFRELTGPEAQIETLDIETRVDANKPEFQKQIENATGVFFTGGDQYRITRLLGGTKIDTALHSYFHKGLILAGTSAGASMMSSIMIINGPAETTAKVGMTNLGAGMEFLPGVIIDQHFAQRGRINRLLAAIAQYPHHLGIGIDENTALIVEGHCFRTIGEGSVTILDAGDFGQGMSLREGGTENLAICDIRLHLLSSGHSFDLRQRRPFF